MAINLPYPDLVFVPLDVLSADELNHIVANYTAIASAFPVTSANITAGAVGANALASSAVTSAKLGTQAVTRDKIANGAVGISQIDSSYIEVLTTDPGPNTTVSSAVKLTVVI